MGQAASFVGIALAFVASSTVGVWVGCVAARWIAVELLGEAWA